MLACFIKYLYIRPIRHELRKKIMKYVSRRICMKMNYVVLIKSLKNEYYLPTQLIQSCQLCHPNYTTHMEYYKKVPS